MTGPGLGRLAAMWLAALVALVALPGAAHAAIAPIERSCIAYSSLKVDPVRTASSAARWDCRGARADLGPERALLRFALPKAGDAPEYVTFRRSAFERLHVMVVDADGTVRQASYGMNDMLGGKAGAYIRAMLPPVTADSRYAVVAFDLPTHAMMLESAELGSGNPADNPDEFRLMLLLATLCGMLLMPLAFNIAFYRVLREPFLLWHAGMALTLLTTIAFTSGVSVYVIDLGMGTVNALMSLIYGAVVATGAMFAWSFIEPGKLHPWLRRALPMCAVWSMVVSGLHTFFPFVLRPIQVDLCYAAYIPVMAVFFIAVIDASMRRSRAVMFQLAGWMPLMMVALLRIVSMIVPVVRPTDAMLLFYFGVVLEALATTLGVADRFLAIRRQRDRARTEAGMLERLSERDPLTGLLNRRVIEERFPLLRADGFETLAVLDLDRFKAINDSHGHATGDHVLEAVATALAADKDTLSFRMGGEEFLLLLRGKDAARRAEQRRQAIALRVGQALPELGQVVTASMGLVEIPPDVMPEAGFDELYERADRLLYQAKQMGRNRTASERVKLFVPRRTERRRVAA